MVFKSPGNYHALAIPATPMRYGADGRSDEIAVALAYWCSDNNSGSTRGMWVFDEFVNEVVLDATLTEGFVIRPVRR